MTRPEPDFERMRAEMMREVDRLSRRKSVRTRLGVAASIAVVVAAATGAVWVVLASQELRENSAYCYEEASTSSRVQQVGDPSPVGEDRVARAIDLCGSVWRAGFLGDQGSTRPPNDGRVHPVPSLFVCQQRDGTLAVFPDEGTPPTCEELGLAAAP